MSSAAQKRAKRKKATPQQRKAEAQRSQDRRSQPAYNRWRKQHRQRIKDAADAGDSKAVEVLAGGARRAQEYRQRISTAAQSQSHPKHEKAKAIQKRQSLRKKRARQPAIETRRLQQAHAFKDWDETRVAAEQHYVDCRQELTNLRRKAILMGSPMIVEPIGKCEGNPRCKRGHRHKGLCNEFAVTVDQHKQHQLLVASAESKKNDALQALRIARKGRPKGNQAANDAKVVQRLESCSQRLEADPFHVHALANRATCRLMLFDAAGCDTDCNTALVALNNNPPSWLTAFQGWQLHVQLLVRRAEARKKLCRLTEAQHDLDTAERVYTTSAADYAQFLHKDDKTMVLINRLRDQLTAEQQV